jgi:hypothetical protein
MVDRGELRSDIDVGFAAEPQLTVEDHLRLAADVESETGRDVDLVDLASAHGLILKEILTTGIIIRRDPEFLRTKMLEMYDDEATLRPLLDRARRERLEAALGQASSGAGSA